MFSPQYVLDEILPLAVAAYDPFASVAMNSRLPAGWTLIAPIQPADFGYIAQNGDTAVVAFRGTESADEWAHDFDFEAASNSYGPGRVHRGFMAEYFAVRMSVWDALESIAYEKLIIIGHSLGAPMAVYCAADIAKWAPQYAARVIGFTFESPKPGDREFVDDFNAKFPVWWSVQNVRDIIPTQPPPPIFTEHAGTTILIDGGIPWEQMDKYVRITHGLESGCKPGLLKLAAEKRG